MEPEFNVGQILQIAERVERNGASFYLRMANRFCDQVQQNICRGLAAWRSKQENAFAEHRRLFYEGLGELRPVDSGDYVLSHPSVMADLAVFADELYVGRALTGRERRKEIINDAIVRAEDAIIFYRG
jgi:rubrerythrin